MLCGGIEFPENFVTTVPIIGSYVLPFIKAADILPQSAKSTFDIIIQYQSSMSRLHIDSIFMRASSLKFVGGWKSSPVALL